MTEKDWLVVLLIGGLVAVTAAAVHDRSCPQCRPMYLALLVAGVVGLVVGFVGVGLT